MQISDYNRLKDIIVLLKFLSVEDTINKDGLVWYRNKFVSIMIWIFSYIIVTIWFFYCFNKAIFMNSE